MPGPAWDDKTVALFPIKAFCADVRRACPFKGVIDGGRGMAVHLCFFTRAEQGHFAADSG